MSKQRIQVKTSSPFLLMNQRLVYLVVSDLSLSGILGNHSDCLMRIYCHKVEIKLLQLQSAETGGKISAFTTSDSSLSHMAGQIPGCGVTACHGTGQEGFTGRNS